MNMKKVYKSPSTTAVQLLGTNTIMSGSPKDMFISIHDGSGAGPTSGMQ